MGNKIVNLYGDTLHYLLHNGSILIFPCEGEVKNLYNKFDENFIDGVPVYSAKRIGTICLPPEENDVFYIVPFFVKVFLPDRNDLLTVMEGEKKHDYTEISYLIRDLKYNN